MATRCKGKNQAGKACRAYAVADGDGYCFAHAPEKARERAKARRKGGQSRYPPIADGPTAVEDLDGIRAGLERLLVAGWKGELSPQMVSALRGAYSLGLKVLEIGELQEQLAEIEQRLDAAGL